MGIHIGGWKKSSVYFAKLNIDAAFGILDEIGVRGDHGNFLSSSN